MTITDPAAVPKLLTRDVAFWADSYARAFPLALVTVERGARLRVAFAPDLVQLIDCRPVSP